MQKAGGSPSGRGTTHKVFTPCLEICTISPGSTSRHRKLQHRGAQTCGPAMAFYHTPAALSAPVGLLLATPGQQPEEGAGTSQKTGRTNQEEQCCAEMEPQEVEAEVGRHWADEEVRALLQTWAERRAELQGAARNKSIFQEMALRLQRLGVERSWKQCRTKYKNLKYDYKSARHSPHRTMKFYSEVEAIMQGRDLSHTWRGQPMSSCLDEQNISPDRSEDGCCKARVVQTAGGTVSVGGAGADTVNMANSVGVADTVGVVDAGRNWQEEEVRALLSVWAEPAVRRQLENATRNRDIFLRVSERLRHLGVELPAAYSHAATSLTPHPSQAGLAPVPRAGSGTAGVRLKMLAVYQPGSGVRLKMLAVSQPASEVRLKMLAGPDSVSSSL
ncbi:hypothetical protein JZ751_016623 [Albula glossodonta]|uniref:Myb/SANT-like DNA-binding domain-containing protein n=1 Tax=Albula glossodonta TaxID=121402 RepID=A0A8T2MUU3_9TELE|nr:hypothetical protein JZ751_016623 [Albula glossodonta]